MNKSRKKSRGVVAISPGEVRAACEIVLASRMFIKASCMNRLLRFLVEKALSGEHCASEKEIGVGVFERNATSYNTNDDPIVRVQISRLRVKLKKYYETLGADADIEIVIPAGRYMPTVRRMNETGCIIKRIPLFMVYPFECVSHYENGEELANGLYSELVHRLFQTFGNIVVANSLFVPDAPHQFARAKVDHQVEGCIQVDAEHVRTSIRLVETATGRITWSEQFNRDFAKSIALQDELATSICDALKRFLSRRR